MECCFAAVVVWKRFGLSVAWDLCVLAVCVCAIRSVLGSDVGGSFEDDGQGWAVAVFAGPPAGLLLKIFGSWRWRVKR